MNTMPIRLEQSKNEIITSHAGLALIGQAMGCTDLDGHLAPLPFRRGIPHRDILVSYLGLLALGKTDYEALNNYRDDAFFKDALGLTRTPSAERMRQRLDEQAEDYRVAVEIANLDFLMHHKVPCTPLWTGHVALDMDLFPQDNSKTQKEGVSRTYKGYDGLGVMAAYLGAEGWNLLVDLKPGKENAQKEFDLNLDHALLKARCLTDAPLLLRLDAAHDAQSNRHALHGYEKTDFIIKWNPRQERAEEWMADAERLGDEAVWESPREGKRVVTFSYYHPETDGGVFRFDRRVMRIVERTIDKHGQRLVLPEYDMEGWWTSLLYADADIIALYADHATSEQFHSEFKTDLDLERLPSGKFATNQLIMAMGSMIYNLLRWMGLVGLLGAKAPVRHSAKRRRVRTVMQELINLAGKFYRRSRYQWLRFGKYCRAFEAFCQVSAKLRPASG